MGLEREALKVIVSAAVLSVAFEPVINEAPVTAVIIAPELVTPAAIRLVEL
jgi:hypothetical protein